MAISRTRRAALERDEQSETRFDNDSIRYNLKKLVKDNIRLLPLVDEGQKILKRIGTHFVMGRGYVCPRVTFGEECPICTLQAELRNSRDDDEKALADDISVSIK